MLEGRDYYCLLHEKKLKDGTWSYHVTAISNDSWETSATGTDHEAVRAEAVDKLKDLVIERQSEEIRKLRIAVGYGKLTHA